MLVVWRSQLRYLGNQLHRQKTSKMETGSISPEQILEKYFFKTSSTVWTLEATREISSRSVVAAKLPPAMKVETFLSLSEQLASFSPQQIELLHKYLLEQDIYLHYQ